MATYRHIRAPVFTSKNVCSFTGKERDAETGYSYFGARYYDSDLSGLFLSVDPMADKYPGISPLNATHKSALRAPLELVPYCAWNPISLIDLYGKEPVKPLIRYGGNGVFYVNVDNLRKPTRSKIKWANEYHQYWPANSIGIDLRVGQLSFKYQNESTYSAMGVKPEHTSVPVEPPIAKTTGLPDKRFSRGRRIVTGPAAGAGGKVMGLLSFGVNLINYASSFYQSNSFYKDNKELQRQIGVLNTAYNIVNQALSNNLLPSEFANNLDLTASLVNYIFQGENYHNDKRITKYGNELLKMNDRYEKNTGKYKPLLEE